MNLEEYRALDATALAARIREGQVSASEAVRAALSCIDNVQPTCNAFAFIYRDEAPEAAGGR